MGFGGFIYIDGRIVELSSKAGIFVNEIANITHQSSSEI